MHVETKNSTKELENSELTPEKSEHLYSKKRYIQIVITNYRHRQIEELVKKFGLARSVSDFTRDALMEKIDKNEHLLEDRFLPPSKKKKRRKRKQRE